jgi:virulence factor Mce-like protein
MFTRFKPKSPIDAYNKVWLGTIALVAIVAVVAAVLTIGALEPGKTRYTAEFAQAAQLRSGDRVTVAGISVGNVDALELAGDRVIVKFYVRNNVRLGPDTSAAIKLTTILGSRYLELSPAGDGGLDNRQIPLASTNVPYNLQETLADATSTFEQVDADHIAQSLTTLSHSLTGVPEALPRALTNLHSLASVISDRRDQLKTLLTSTEQLTSLIRDQKANIGAIIKQGRSLLVELTSRREAVHRLFAGATALADSLNKVLNGRPGLDELLVSVRDFAEMIASHDDLFRNVLQVLPVPMRNIANVTGSGMAADSTLPAGPLIDSWMCAISGRAQQFNLVEYFKDCE